MTTAVVILNWNGRGFLEKYLPSVIHSAEGMDGVSIIVADNGSTDGSIELLEKDFPSAGIIRLDKNYGFTGGYNKALAKIQADCFLLLNSDIEVPEGWLPPLVEWMEIHPECGICGPKLHMIDDRDRFEYAGAAGGYIDKFGYPFCRGRVLKRTEIDEGQYDLPAEVLWVSGAALMIRSSLFFSLGGFCKEFFAHMEEIDLCWRARLEGWTVCVVPRSVVYHLGGGSLPQDSPRKLFFNYRNNLLMLSRCLPATFSLCMLYMLLGKGTPDELGPDPFENVQESFSMMSKKLKKDHIETSIFVGTRIATRLIRRRMLRDGMSALVYLFQGHADYVKAVWDAHKEFRTMRRKPDISRLRHILKDSITGKNDRVARVMMSEEALNGNLFGPKFGLKGMWSQWIVLQSFLRKDDIFEFINEDLL